MLFESPYDEALSEMRAQPKPKSTILPWEREGLSFEAWQTKLYKDFTFFTASLEPRLASEKASAEKSLKNF